MARAAPVDRKMFEERRALLQVEADMNAGDLDRAAEELTSVLAARRVRGDIVFLPSRPDLAARFANLALERGIETAYVRGLIERHRLVAPDDACAAWPFRLRVRALGGFDLSRDGATMRYTGKTQQRPLDLLKLVVSLGGKDVDAESVMAALWPDSDGAAAKGSFDSAMFRLRKLLDVDDALELASGKLSLNQSLVWTDVRALDAALHDANDAPPALAARRLLGAYPGPLLGGEESPWLAKPRDALRARVVRALTDLGQKLERAGDFAAAIDVYRRALEADNLAESLYRGLMRAMAATGDRAEAMNTFRRCRELLSIVLGVKPSAETSRLYQEIANS